VHSTVSVLVPPQLRHVARIYCPRIIRKIIQHYTCNFVSSLCVRHFIISIVKPTRCTSLFYFCSSTLHVSDGLLVHHQASYTPDDRRSFRPSSGVFHHLESSIIRSLKLLMMDGLSFHHQESRTPGDGREDHPNHVDCYSKNKVNLRN